MRPICLLLIASLGLCAQEATPPTAPPEPAAVAAPTPSRPAPRNLPLLDEGLLDPAWFGGQTELAKGMVDAVDFVWIRPGLRLAGHTLWMKPWEDPTMLKKGRDGKDNAKATVLTDTIPSTLRGALAGALGAKAQVSRNAGDLELQGRVVDCNAGSTAAKMFFGFGAGSETVTFDLKLVDAKTGDLLLAAHHRTISGTSMSNIEGKLVKWADQFAAYLAKAVGE